MTGFKTKTHLSVQVPEEIQEFIDWLTDEEYIASRYPTISLRELKLSYEKLNDEEIRLSLIKKAIEHAGYSIATDGKAYIYQTQATQKRKMGEAEITADVEQFVAETEESEEHDEDSQTV